MLNSIKVDSQISKGGGIISKMMCESLSTNELFFTKGKIVMWVADVALQPVLMAGYLGYTKQL